MFTFEIRRMFAFFYGQNSLSYSNKMNFCIFQSHQLISVQSKRKTRQEQTGNVLPQFHGVIKIIEFSAMAVEWIGRQSPVFVDLIEK